MRNLFTFVVFFLIASFSLVLVGCGDHIDLSINFYVDDEVFHTTKVSLEDINEALISEKHLDAPEQPIKEGYTFAGWFYYKESSDQDFEENNLKKLRRDKYLSLFAHWEANEYMIFLDVNDGDALANVSEIVIFDSTYNLPQPTREGHTFEGWYTEREAGQALTDSFGFSNSTWDTADDMTVYARWVVTEYNIEIFQNMWRAGTISGGGYKEEKTDVTIKAISNDGYAWLGWYEGDEIISKKQTYTFIADSSKLIEARWMPLPISLEKNTELGGSVKVLTEVPTIGEEITYQAITQSGYTWDGWYDDEEVKVEENPLYSFILSEEKQSLEARWKEHFIVIKKDSTPCGEISIALEDSEAWSVLVKFESRNAATNWPSTQLLKYGSKLTYPSIPKRTGYIFAGWYIDEETKNLFNFNSTITADLKLYAKWQQPISKAGNISTGETISNVKFDYDTKFFAYVPLVSEQIAIFSKATNGDPKGYLFDSEMELLAEDDDSKGSRNFEILYDVIAGELYYIGISNYFDYEDIPAGRSNITVQGTAHPVSEVKVNLESSSDFYSLRISEGTQVTIKANSNSNSSKWIWDGWYDKDIKVSAEISFSFKVADSEIFEARWKEKD